MSTALITGIGWRCSAHHECNTVGVMNYRTVKFSVDDIAIDYDNVAASLTTTCCRDGGRWRIDGLCQLADVVYFPLSEYRPPCPVRYVLAPFDDNDSDDIAYDLLMRWRSGFITRGVIHLSNLHLGLFELRSTETACM